MWSPDFAEPPALSARAVMAGLAIFLGSLLLFALVSATVGLPLPRVHDEFSYLLAGDTFAHGRVTNPTHPLWPYFETFHVIHVPTYQSKFPPGQGLVLALGQRIWHPALGVWLCTAAACAAIYWCLTRFVPWQWAGAGAAVTAFHPQILRWSQTYWGGSLALLGGALVVGALRHPTSRHVLIGSAGVMMLANSRPYEGLVLTLLALPFVIRQLRLPALLLLLAGTSCMAYYNARVTGSALTMPYMVHERQYMVVPPFVFQSLRPVPHYRNDRLKRFYADDCLSSSRTTTADKMMRLVRGAFRLFLPSMLGEAMTAPFPPILLSIVFVIPMAGALMACREDPSLRVIALLIVLFLICLLPLTWLGPHYAAPAAPLLIVLLTAGLRYAWRWRVATAVFAVVWLASAVVSVGIMRIGYDRGQWSDGVRRAAIVEQLQRSGGKHLVIVHYVPSSFLHFEWVENDADIEGSPVVWARELTDERPLFDHFRTRHIWRLDTSLSPPRLTPLSRLANRIGNPEVSAVEGSLRDRRSIAPSLTNATGTTGTEIRPQ
jgi:hypothetical protein